MHKLLTFDPTISYNYNTFCPMTKTVSRYIQMWSRCTFKWKTINNDISECRRHCICIYIYIVYILVRLR